MAKGAIFLAISLAMTHVAIHVSSQPIQLKYLHNCQVELGNYTTNSTYESSLKTVLSDLQEHASTKTFYSTSAGNGSNTVHGQYYCRGDINSTLCKDCIQQAAQAIHNKCSLAKAGIIWYTICTLRYNNESMHGVEAERPGVYRYSLSNITSSDQGEFLEVLNGTMKSLIQEAVTTTGDNSTTSLFATGDAPVSAFLKVYGLVQCSPDLNATQCETCLLSTYDVFGMCCQESPLFVYVFYPSCQMMYSTTGRFYFDPNATTSPSPPPPIGVSGNVRRSGSIKLGIVTTALLLLMFVVNI